MVVAEARGLRLAFDAGGTFTDVVFHDRDGKLTARKLPSLHERVAGDIRALALANVDGNGVRALIHATTLASNAVIQRNVARTALMTTRGFRDVLDIKAQKRPNVYDPEWERLPPLIPRELTGEVGGRILADGAQLEELAEDDVERLVEEWLAAGLEAIAISLVNSYVDPGHERRVAAILSRTAPGLVVCCSHEIDADMGEYERTSTTAINASLMPVVGRYLDNLESALAELDSRLMIMRSTGGLMDAGTARSVPAHMIESGSAAGALAAARLATERGLERVLAFDMGGTTAKACLIQNGACLERPWGEIGQGATVATRLFGGEGYALRVPSLDIVEIGAGGGSIGWLDEGGALRVGPHSAEADPGPACYARGGAEPTVTDACLLLGYVNPTALASGSLRVDPELAKAAATERLATPLGSDLLSVAWGMFSIANATMMRALRAVSTERGYDARTCDLVAFGGAGPVHAAALADSLDIRRVFVPPLAGVFSALGLLLAEVRHDFVIPLAGHFDDLDADRVLRAFAAVETEAREELVRSCGGDPPGYTVTRSAAVRYAYQIGEIVVPIDAGWDASNLIGNLRVRFVEAHMNEFGFARDDAPVELQNLRLSIASEGVGAEFSSVGAVPAGRADDGAERIVHFGPRHGSSTAPVVSRAALVAASGPVAGPLLIEEDDTTIVVPPGWTASCSPSDWIVVLERTE